MSDIQYIPPGAETNAAYHASPAWSSTELKRLLKSGPAVAMAHRKGDASTPTSDAMNFGTAFHSMMSGTMTEDVVVAPNDDGRTKAFKDAKDAARGTGKVLIRPRDVEVLGLMADSVRANEDVSSLLVDNPLCECALRKGLDGFALQCRFDYVHPNWAYALDWKTIADVDDAERAVWDRGYYVSWGLYRLLAFEYTGSWMDMHFVFVEKQPPYRARLVKLDSEWHDIAQHDIKRALQVLSICQQTNTWEDDRTTVVSKPPCFLTRPAASAEDPF